MSINSSSAINAFQSIASSMGASAPGGRTGAVSKGAVGKDQFIPSPSLNMLQQLVSQNGDDGDASKETGMSGFDLLKQQSEMLSNMLQMKLKNFESNLVSSMKSAGIDPNQQMSIQNGLDGFLSTADSPDKAKIQKLLGGNNDLLAQFKEISQLAGLLGTLQQVGNQSGAGSSVASQYAQQSQQLKSATKPDAQFVLQVMQGNAAFSFE